MNQCLNRSIDRSIDQSINQSKESIKEIMNILVYTYTRSKIHFFEKHTEYTYKIYTIL